MAAADKLWFELGVRDEISGVLEKLMRNSEKLAGMLTDDVVEMKNVYKNILDISNVYDKIYVTQKRISDLRGAKTLTADEKKGLKEMSKELENVRKEFAAIRGIGAIVSVVPDVIRNGRKVRRGIHRQQRLGRHGLRRI